MCGILAVISKKEKLDASACRRALSGMTWRGPDLCVSQVFENRVFLGQTILSLTGDISEGNGAHLESVSGRFSVAFNGEIYNFKDLIGRRLSHLPNLFSSKCTDTEVLANLHETLPSGEVAGELDGMYVYAALDRRNQTLTLARDVQGEKSLYIYEDSSRIVVSSEIVPIVSLVSPVSLDAQALRDYFHTRHLMLFERTIYRGIRQLAPGRTEKLDLKTFQWKTEREWRLKDWIDPGRMKANAARSLDSLADELDSLMSDCVKQMLPQGRRYAAVVSGGIDSSLIARYVASEGRPELFVAVNNLGKDLISADLSGFEKALGAKIDVLPVDQVSYSAEITRCQRACASPLLAHSFVAQSLQSAYVRSKGCRVLFGGEGGDEIFGGYPAYLKEQPVETHFSPSPYTSYNDSEVSFLSDNPDKIRQELSLAWRESLEAYRHVESPQDRTALAMMYCDAAFQLPSVGLRGADLMSMMWSIETRSVFLRRPIYQFALNLPLSAKLDRTAPNPLSAAKAILKRLFVRYYGEELLFEKQGFSGFPNESAAYLGRLEDYLSFEALGIVPESAQVRNISRSVFWKLTNVEYFLRNTIGFTAGLPSASSFSEYSLR